MTDDETVFTSKIYLVKIKVGHDFKDEDLLWAIGYRGGDNIDFEDFKNIVVVLNNKGLWNPILSDSRVTWKSLKNSADCKALGHSGKPILLLEEVLTFKKILEFAYSQGILNDPKGKEILAAKEEELTTDNEKTSVSLTLEQASGSGPSKGDIITQAMERSKLITSEAAFCASARQLTKTGEFAFPNPVPVVPSVDGDHPMSGDGIEIPPVHHMPGSSYLTQEDGQFFSNIEIVESEVEVIGETVSGHEVEDEVFDPSKFNVDAVDNELALLEDPAENDLAKKNSRYKSLAKTLRKSLSFSCLTVQRLMKEVDSKDMQLAELSSLSTSQIVDALKPELAKISAIGDQVKSLSETVKDLDAKMDTEIASVRTEIGEVASQVSHKATIATDQSNNIVRHLSTFGMVDTGASYDIPGSLSAVHRILNEEIAPVFRAGQVVSQVSLYGQQGSVNQVVAPPTTPASQIPSFGITPPTPATAATVGDGLLVAPSDPALLKNYLPLSNPTKGKALAPQPGPSNSRQVAPSPSHTNTRPGTSAQGNPSQSASFSNGVRPQQHTTPSSGYPFTPYSAPPPPIKKMRTEKVGTSAVRSLFAPYSHPPPQLNQPNNLFSRPPPALNQAGHHGHTGTLPPATKPSYTGPRSTTSGTQNYYYQP